jgi:hypothetical protein
MEPITTTVTHISNGTEEDLKIFDSMLNSAQIDINAQHADQSMFTTPKTKYANEAFVPLKYKLEYKNGSLQLTTLSISAIILVILLFAFHTK